MLPPVTNNEIDEMNWNSFAGWVVKFGIPGVLSLWLVYWATAKVDSQLRLIEGSVTAHQNESKELKGSVDSLKYEVQEQQNRTNLILQQICVNGASFRDRQNCFR